MTSPNNHSNSSLSPEIDAAITAAIKEGFDKISNELNKVTEKLFSNYEQQRREVGEMRNALADVFMTTALNLRTSSLPPPPPPQQQQQIQPQQQQQQQIASRPPEHPFIPFTVNNTNRGTRTEQLIAPMISSTPPFLANQIDRESSSSPATLSHPQRVQQPTAESSPTVNSQQVVAVNGPSTSSSGSNSSPTTVSNNNNNSNNNRDQPIPTYTMSRKLKSVVDVWKEYDQGISGQTPVRFLEDTFGTKWRKDRSLSRFFSRRNVFYREIKRIAQEENIPELTAAIQLERKRCNLKVSLDKFSKIISTERGN